MGRDVRFIGVLGVWIWSRWAVLGKIPSCLLGRFRRSNGGSGKICPQSLILTLFRYPKLGNFLALALLLSTILGAISACERDTAPNLLDDPMREATPAQTAALSGTPGVIEPSTPVAAISPPPRQTASVAPTPTKSARRTPAESSSPEPEASPTPLITLPHEVQSTSGGSATRTAPDDLNIDFYTAKDLVSISSGRRHSCGLRDNGTAVCWGKDWEGQASEPKETFSAISAFGRYSCGARTRGGVECWGEAQGPIPDRISEATESYVSISIGDGHGCVLDEDGGVDCWAGRSGASNDLDHGPVGEFSFLDSGYTHACGVRTDGSAMCWGGEYEEGVVILPGEQFKSISAFS